MALQLFTIKKRATFVNIRENGVFIRGNNINIQKLINKDLDNKIGVGYIVTKKIGNAVKRNKVKRRLRNIMSQIIKISKINFNYSYLFITKKSIINAKFIDIKETIIKDYKKIK